MHWWYYTDKSDSHSPKYFLKFNIPVDTPIERRILLTTVENA